MDLQIAYRIADHLEPNPLVYGRLALVSKGFYKVFTADFQWKYLDPYHINTEIFEHFKQTITPSDRLLLQQCWSPVNKDCTDVTYPLGRPPNELLGTNLYLWLGYFCSFADAHRSDLETRINDCQLLWCASHLNGKAYLWSSNQLRLDRESCIAALSRWGCMLGSLSDDLRDDKEIVMTAVSQGCKPQCTAHVFFGGPLEYASNRLKQDRDVIIRAVQASGFALVYAPDEFRSDRELVLQAVKQNGAAILYAQCSLDREIVLAAVASYGLAICGTPYVDDEEVVFTAVSNAGSALEFASQRLKSDPRIVQAAISQDAVALIFADRSLINENMVRYAIKQDYQALALMWTALNESARILDGQIKGNPYPQHVCHLVLKGLKNHRAYLRLSTFWSESEREYSTERRGLLAIIIDTYKRLVPGDFDFRI